MAKKVFKKIKKKVQAEKEERVNPHKTFKRSYREDYQRKLEMPGIMYHIMTSFQTIFKNWKLFLPLLIIMVVLNVLFIGVLNESNYVRFQDALSQANYGAEGSNLNGFSKAGLILVSAITTGGWVGESSGASTVLWVLFFLIIWLTTIFLLRHIMAGHKIKLRDGLYNAMAPLVSTFLVFVVALVQCIPIFVLIIALSAAVKTDFLATPFYALVFLAFAILMIVLSGYLLSSSLIAFIAVSVPGMYPLRALQTASDLMMGRRIKFILRLVALLLALGLMWVVVMLPLIMFDMWMKQFEWTAGIPFVPVCLTIMTCFSAIYITTYLYLYYRWMLKSK